MVAMQQERVRSGRGGGGRHGALFWQEESGSVGVRLMRGMGWREGKGLGKAESGHTQHAIKARKKLDQKGLGAATALSADAQQRHFAQATTSLFNDLLTRLNQQHQQPQREKEQREEEVEDDDQQQQGPEAAVAAAATEVDEGAARRTALSSISRAVGRRSLYGRFSRAKDTTTYSTSSMHEILGTTRSTTTSSSSSGSITTAAVSTSSTSSVPTPLADTRTSQLSMSEYFSQRMHGRAAAATAAAQADFLHTAHFDHLQRISAVGRGGLGFRSTAAHEQPHCQQSHLTQPPTRSAPQHTPRMHVEPVAEQEREDEAAETRSRRKEERRRQRKREREDAERTQRGEEEEELDSSEALQQQPSCSAAAEPGRPTQPGKLQREQEAWATVPVRAAAEERAGRVEETKERRLKKKRLRVERSSAE